MLMKIMAKEAMELTFQSSDVMSFLFSFDLALACFNTRTLPSLFIKLELFVLSAMLQILAVESRDLKHENSKFNQMVEVKNERYLFSYDNYRSKVELGLLR
jgi:hypothetical protein